MWLVTENVTMMGHWKGHSNVLLKSLLWHVTGDWKGYDDRSLKRLWWRVTENTTLMCHWKAFYDMWLMTQKATLTYHWKVYYNVRPKRLRCHRRLCSIGIWDEENLCSDSEFAVIVDLYKDMSSCTASSDFTDTLPLHLYVTHVLHSSTCLFTWSPCGTRVQFATVVSEKASHLFHAEHTWKEVLDLSW
jgi:hypothetical protein